MKKNYIKSKATKKAAAAIMAIMIMTTPMTNLSFAAEAETGEPVAPQTTTEQAAPAETKSEAPAESKSEAPAAPEKPAATSHEDNGKIEEYNKKVDEYNESARQHNEAVDKEYADAVEDTNKKNEEIDQHNAAEEQRVKDAEERNAQAQKAADEENRKIDEENAAEKARVDQVNKEEDEKAAASQKARAEAEAQNKEAEEHNAKVDKYNADLKQYEKDLAQYEYDRKIEAQILNLGYGSVEQYNAAIDRAYNTPAKKSVEKNATAPKISVQDTYTLTEAAEKSGVKVTVHIEHNFQDIGLSYTEDFEIDANDVIKVNPISAICESTSPGYATFYYNTDDQHQMGYWMEAYSSVGSNAKHNQYGWNCGDTHEISYKDGKNHASDKEEIVVEYNYMWNPLKVYKTYNTPKEPVAPENPGEAKALVNVPDLYTPSYEKYVEKQHVAAEQEEIGEAVLWEHLPSPVKRAYISLLDYMTLFDAPQAADTTETVAEPAVAEADAPQAAEQTLIAKQDLPKANTADPAPAAQKAAAAAQSAAPAANATINDSATPLAAASTEEITENAVPMSIADSETPMAAAGAWALINLLCALMTALLSLIMMIRYFRAGREEDDENTENTDRNRKGSLRLASMIPAIGAIAAFILTENMANPMILTDRWTVMMIVILAIQTGVALLVGKKEHNEETLNA